VEDNPHDARLTLRALKKHNLTNSVVHVKDGAEALEFLFGSGAYADRKGDPNPRVILLDLKLPKVSGIEVLQKIRADGRTCRIPVVMMTSSNEDRDIIDSYRLGVNSYVVKPIEFEKFVDVVADLGLYWVLVNQPPV
jgi:CheY-like chemotaxis protein